MRVKDIRKLLLNSLINPKEPGPLKTILEQHDVSYYEMRAQELISEARLCVSGFPTPNENQLANYHDRMIKAITLLTLARYHRDDTKRNK